jgi:hypothetical protein
VTSAGSAAASAGSAAASAGSAADGKEKPADIEWADISFVKIKLELAGTY